MPITKAIDSPKVGTTEVHGSIRKWTCKGISALGPACVALVAVFSLCLAFQMNAFGQSAAELSAQAGAAMQDRNYAEAERLYAKLTHLAPDVPEIYSNLGLARYYQGKFKAAEEAFLTAQRLNAHLFVPNFFLGKTHLDQGQFTLALPFLEEAARLQPAEKEPRRLIAATLVGLHREDEAIQQYQKLVREDPRDIESLYGLALVYTDRGKNSLGNLLNYKNSCYAELARADFDTAKAGWETIAAEEYRKAIAISPGLPGLRTALGNILLKSKKWQEAQQAFQDEIALDPNSYEARYNLAVIALQKGNLDAAAHYLDEAVHIRPEFFVPLPDLAISTVSGQQSDAEHSALEASGGKGSFGAAFVLASLPDHGGQAAAWRTRSEQERDRLIEDFKQRFQRFSQKPIPMSQRRVIGLRYLSEKRFAEGIQILSPLLKGSQPDNKVRIAIARALFQEGRYEDVYQLLRGRRIDDPESYYVMGSNYEKLTVAMMERIVSIDPNSARTHQMLGDSYFAGDNFPEAQREYESALKIQPDDPGLYYVLGNAYFKQFKFKEAEQAYARTASLEPYDAQAYLMEGTALVQLHEYQSAVPVLQRALELDAHLLEAHAQLGKALDQVGEPEQAVRHLELAASTDTDGSLHFQLFKLYRKLGEKEKADAAFLISQKIKVENQRTVQENTAASVKAK